MADKNDVLFYLPFKDVLSLWIRKKPLVNRHYDPIIEATRPPPKKELIPKLSKVCIVANKFNQSILLRFRESNFN